MLQHALEVLQQLAVQNIHECSGYRVSLVLNSIPKGGRNYNLRMLVSEFDYELPDACIAQEPPSDGRKLQLLRRA